MLKGMTEYSECTLTILIPRRLISIYHRVCGRDLKGFLIIRKCGFTIDFPRERSSLNVLHKFATESRTTIQVHVQLRGSQYYLVGEKNNFSLLSRK